jgi:hypothetical protein
MSISSRWASIHLVNRGPQAHPLLCSSRNEPRPGDVDCLNDGVGAPAPAPFCYSPVDHDVIVGGDYPIFASDV